MTKYIVGSIDANAYVHTYSQGEAFTVTTEIEAALHFDSMTMACLAIYDLCAISKLAVALNFIPIPTRVAEGFDQLGLNL